MDELQKARDCALRLLARRDHTVSELRRKLIQRGFPSDSVENLIASFSEAGYLNDRRFAEKWVSSALENSRCFGHRLRAELSRKGIDRSTISDVVSEQMENRDERDTLQQLFERRYPGLNPTALDDREKRRIFGFLQRRGFSAAAIMGIFRGDCFE